MIISILPPLLIPTIKDLLSYFGHDDLRHPLFHILPVADLQHLPAHFPIDFSFGFYAIGLVRNLQGEVKCGRKSYDFQKGTMFFLGPNQLVGHALAALREAEGWLLFFHRAYLANHSLEKDILDYGFFDYTVNEALHLSKHEEQSIVRLFENIYTEHQSPIDKYSRSVVVSNLALLLTYTDRNYGRQFITRNEVESSFLLTFDQLLNDYYQQRDLGIEGPPSVVFFADHLHMSAKYLGDKLRVLTGKTAQEHIHLKLMERAKLLLQQKQFTVAEVAFQLGFEYPQYFSRFFKKRAGVSPKAFQALN